MRKVVLARRVSLIDNEKYKFVAIDRRGRRRLKPAVWDGSPSFCLESCSEDPCRIILNGLGDVLVNVPVSTIT